MPEWETPKTSKILILLSRIYFCSGLGDVYQPLKNDGGSYVDQELSVMNPLMRCSFYLFNSWPSWMVLLELLGRRETRDSSLQVNHLTDSFETTFEWALILPDVIYERHIVSLSTCFVQGI